ncbi:MAG: NUDIX domain-containing protein [Spirochaetota bacterium]
MSVLASTLNPFRGREIDPFQLPGHADSFARDLDESIAAWRAEGVKVVWLQLPVERAVLVPAAVAAGFAYHHATDAWLELTLRLEPDAYVPPFATHYIGAGGVVLTDDRRLLVIQERHHRHRHYKLPGGALHPGEHIVDAVIREVREETGIAAEFMSLVCFRHWHGYRYGKSDIYFVARLRPLSFEIELDESEIAECMWMPVDEYLHDPDTHEFNRRIVRSALTMEGAERDAACPVLRPDPIAGYGTPETHELFFPASGSTR